MRSKKFWEYVEEFGGGPAVFTGLLIFLGVIGVIVYVVFKALFF